MGETAHEEFTSTDFIPTDDLKLVKTQVISYWLQMM